jgi:endonuclease YncB( thermonuclease family)
MRILQLAAVLALVAIGQPSEPGSALADTARMVEVIDPATIDVQMDSGASQRIRLVGIASDFARDDACAEARARGRAQELLEGQGLTIDVQPDQALGSDVPAASYVWLSDGQNLAEILLREGDVLASLAEWHPRQTSFAAAEAAAIADHAGIWAPGACSAVSSDTQQTVDADQAGIGDLVASSALSLPQARTAVQVLREQARSGPLVASSGGWQATTNAAIGWTRQAAQSLQRPPGSLGPVGQAMYADLAALGRRLQDQADAFEATVASGDLSGMGATATPLAHTDDCLSAAITRVNALASAYGVGD